MKITQVNGLDGPYFEANYLTVEVDGVEFKLTSGVDGGLVVTVSDRPDGHGMVIATHSASTVELSPQR